MWVLEIRTLDTTLELCYHHTFLQGNVLSCKTSAKHVMIFFSFLLSLDKGWYWSRKSFYYYHYFFWMFFTQHCGKSIQKVTFIFIFCSKDENERKLLLLINRIAPGFVKCYTCIYIKKLLFFKIRFIGDIFNILFVKKQKPIPSCYSSIMRAKQKCLDQFDIGLKLWILT